MRLLQIIAILLFTLWCAVMGIRYLARAVAEKKGRVLNVLRTVLTLGFVAGITYPFLLGPAIGLALCSYDGGWKVDHRVDLRPNGYEVDWDPNVGTEFRRQGVDDLLEGHISFFETSSYFPGMGLHRISFGPDDSFYCVRFDEFRLRGYRLPAGKCLEVRPAAERLSRYKVETSPEYWRADAPKKSARLVERASGATTASYTIRYLPGARFTTSGGVSAYRCPVQKYSATYNTEFDLSEHALVAADAPVAIPTTPDDVSEQALASTCRLPTMPNNVEVHRYQVQIGAQPTAVRIDRTGKKASFGQVNVNSPGVPIFLILEAADPVVWNIRLTPGSHIVAVAAYSMDSATAVAGLPPDTPLLITSLKSYARMQNCEWADFDTAIRSALHRGRPEAERLTDPTIFVGPRARDEDYLEFDPIPESRYALVDYLSR